MNQIVIIIDVIGIIVPLIFILFSLLIKNYNRKAQRTLIFGFSFVIAGYLFELARELEFYNVAKILFPFYFPLLFTIYPILYLYIKYIIWEDQKISKRNLLKYFSFPIITFVLLVVYYIPLPAVEKQNILFYTAGRIPSEPSEAIVITSVMVLYYMQLIIFLYALTKIAVYINKAIKEHIVIKEEYLPLWTWILIYVIYTYEIFVTALTFIINIPNDSISIWINSIFNVFIILIGLFGLKQYDLSVQTKLKKLTLHFKDENGAKKVSEKLTIDQKKNIAATLEKYVSEKKFYLDPNLKIEQLAKKIHVSYKNLSLVINELIGKNFTTLLNEYRVEEAKRIIAQNMDIESLGDVYTKVGFNTRSTFNRVFKSITGLTPSEFKESLHSAA